MTGRLRVVIADDHNVVREGLRLILAEADGIHVVGEARDGEEAVRVVQQVKPDVVLMDLMMPKLDGVGAARALAAAGSPARILILTSATDGQGIGDAVRAGVMGYLMKDVLSAELIAAIRNAAAGIPTLHPYAQRQLMLEVATPVERSPLEVLTPRERDVLRLIVAGLGNKQIAGRLSLSAGTVKGYVSEIFEKLGVGDRTQAALLAVRHGLDAWPDA
ncbi:MAG: response regulator transcription factor [Gemmatimonadaceae bacterium]|nr:response regulator transcription factor [Gemmatimonadaceae bacterium]